MESYALVCFERTPQTDPGKMDSDVLVISSFLYFFVKFEIQEACFSKENEKVKIKVGNSNHRLFPVPLLENIDLSINQSINK